MLRDGGLKTRPYEEQHEGGLKPARAQLRSIRYPSRASSTALIEIRDHAAVRSRYNTYES